jgi:hypothetical protein
VRTVAGFTTGRKVSSKSTPGRWVKPRRTQRCLVPLEGAIGLKFVLEDPLPNDNIGPGRTGHQIPGVVLQESTVFFHSRSPIGVSKSATEGLRHRRERHSMVGSGHPEAALRTRAHGVLVGH